MSLLDDVSIVVTPNGYKAGTLYGVLPTATLGSEKITNGDLSNGTVGFTPFNSTIANVSNTLEITNTASYGSAGASVLTTIIGKRYEFTADIKGGTSATALMRAGKNPNGVDLLNVTAFPITSTFVKHTFYFVAKTTTSYVSLWSGSPTIGDTVFFDNISVKEFTASDMDVTRATAATRVDENGLVNYAEVLGSELVVNGDFDTNINSWEQYNSVSTWDNGTIKTTSNTTVAWIRQNDILSTGNFYKIIFKAKASNISQNIHIWNGASFIDTGLSFDSINTYKEFTYYLDFTGAGGQHLILGQQVIGNGDTINFDNVSAKEADLNNVPRIDYTGGGCPHILAEPQRTNLVPYSEDFTQSNWLKVGSPTITPNYGISPDGTLNSTRVQFASSSNSIYEQLGHTIGDAASIYVKGTSGETIQFGAGGSIGGGQLFTLNGEWQRIEFQSTGTSVFFIGTYQSATSRDIEVWGAQLEAGSYTTSYIPTSGSSVTRNKDVFTRDGISSLINSEEGVLFAEMAALANDGTFREITLNNGTQNNVVEVRYNDVDNALQFVVRDGGSVQVNKQYTFSNALNFNKVAFSYKANDFKIFINGTKELTDTSGTVPSGLSVLSFDWDGSNNFIGKVRQLQVYDTALTDNQLIQLTGEAGTHFFESYSEMAETLTYTIQ